MPVSIDDGRGAAVTLRMVYEQPGVSLAVARGGAVSITPIKPLPVDPIYRIAFTPSAALTAIGAATQTRAVSIGAAAATQFLAAVVRARSSQMQAAAELQPVGGKTDIRLIQFTPSARLDPFIEGAQIEARDIRFTPSVDLAAVGASTVSRLGEIAAGSALQPDGAQVEARAVQTSSTAELQPVGGRIVARSAAIAASVTTSFVGEAVAALDPDAAAYISAVETADGQALEPGVAAAIDSFFIGTKADGIFAAIKASCILAGARTMSGALVPLVSTMPAPTNVSIPSGNYDRKLGLKGSPTTGRLETGHFYEDDPQNDRHRAVYVTELPSVDDKLIGMRNRTGFGANANDLVWTTLTRCADLNAQSYTAVAGYAGVSRSANSNYVRRNGGVNTTLNVTSRSQSGTGYEVLIYNDNDGDFDAGSDARISFYSCGTSLDQSQLNARLVTLMSDIDGAIA